MTGRLLIAALAALAPLTAALAQAAPAVQTPPRDFTTTPAVAGSWAYQKVVGGSSARFIDAGGIARVTLQCALATRQVTIAHTSAAPSATLFVWTSSLSRSLAARFEANAVRVSATLAMMDPLLDAMAFSRGRFAVQLAGSSALVVPASAEAARVVEDCRS
jgi:hypothetical protein